MNVDTLLLGVQNLLTSPTMSVPQGEATPEISRFPVEIPESILKLEPELLSQGAEALIFRADHPSEHGRHCIVKYRPPKSYRINELDAPLRKRRTAAESKVLAKLASNNVRCPAIISLDTRNAIIYMEEIDGPSLKQYTWDQHETHTNETLKRLYHEFGEMIALLHSLNIAHGDLTTSNVLIEESIQTEGTQSDPTPMPKLVLIDFGLSSMAASVEDKAVDLYVLERAIQSTHAPLASLLVEQVLDGYSSSKAQPKSKPEINSSVSVMRKLDQVRQRGRKRSMLG